MSPTATQLKSKVTPIERTSPTVKQQLSPQVEIQSNPVFQTVMQDETSSQDKTAAFVSTMLKTNNRAEARQRMKEFIQMREFLANVTKTMNVNAMSAEDSKQLGRVRTVINMMGDHLRKVDEKIAPGIGMVDSFYAVTKNGNLYEVFEKQAKDAEALAKNEQERQAVQQRISDLMFNIESNKSAIKAESTKTGWWSGKVTAEAQAAIDALQTKNAKAEEELATLEAKVKELAEAKSAINSSTKEEYKLFIKMLEMTPEELEKMQEESKQAAIDFVKISDEQLLTLNQDFDAMLDSKNNAQDNVTKLVEVFGILTDGLKQVVERLKDQRTALLVVPEGESMAERSIRENKVADLDEYITELTSSQVTTNQGFANLGIKAMDIRASKERFSKIMALAKTIQVDGIAKASEGLQASLAAINQAAIENAAIGAQQILNSLGRVTDNIQQKEWMRLSTQTENIKKHLEETMARSEEFNESYSEGIEVARKNMAGIQQLMSELGNVVKESLDKGKEFGGLAAETEEGIVSNKASEKPANDILAGFKL